MTYVYRCILVKLNFFFLGKNKYPILLPTLRATVLDDLECLAV